MTQQPGNQTYSQILPALSDFHEGYQEGIQAFKDGIFFPEHDKQWMEEDIVRFVETELSGTRYRRQKRLDTLMGHSPLSYSHNLGFVMGYVHQALNHDHLHDIIA